MDAEGDEIRASMGYVEGDDMTTWEITDKNGCILRVDACWFNIYEGFAHFYTSDVTQEGVVLAVSSDEISSISREEE